MSKILEEKPILKYIDGVDRDLFLMKYNESTKVTDYCKTQIWQVASLATIINFGIVTLSQQFRNNMPCITILILLIMIIVVLVVGYFGCLLINNFEFSANHHRNLNCILYQNCVSEGDQLQKDIKTIKTSENYEMKRDKNNNTFQNLFKAAISIGSIISFLLLFNKIIEISISCCPFSK